MLSIEQARQVRQGVSLSGDRNQCGECGLLFNSVRAFDKHRTGTYGVERRCMTPPEMQLHGMAKNQHGFWVTERLTAEGIAARAFLATERTPEDAGTGSDVVNTAA